MKILITGDSNLINYYWKSHGCSYNFDMPVTCGFEVCFTSMPSFYINGGAAYFHDRHSPTSVHDKHFMILYFLKEQLASFCTKMPVAFPEE